jgi:hypothetical protein
VPLPRYEFLLLTGLLRPGKLVRPCDSGIHTKTFIKSFLKKFLDWLKDDSCWYNNRKYELMSYPLKGLFSRSGSDNKMLRFLESLLNE